MIRWELQVAAPVYDLPIRDVRLFRTERRPSNQALKHNCPDTPPIAAKIVTFATENFGGDIIGGSNSGVSELTPRFTPSVDLIAIRNGQLDLIDGDTIAILCQRLRFAHSLQLLVVGRGMLFGETGGKTEVGEFDVATTIQQNVVRFDIALPESVKWPYSSTLITNRCMNPSLWTASIARVISAM